MKKTGFWDALKTPKGRKIALAVLLIVVIACSSIASLLVTSGGKVVVREIRIDRRGGILSAELYTPKGISAEDSLPAVVVTHGGSCSNGVVSGIAQELARRGFVVLNVSAYGAGESENPLTDDYGSAPGDFASARGLNDAVDFVRTLEYVDKTRIGITGHSMGSIRTNAAADADCSWFTLNDILINILYNDFDVAISEEELYEDAYALAEAKLNAAELSHFQYMAAEQEEFYNTRIKAVLGLGTGPVCLTTYGTRDVEVAGFTVSRMLNTNLGLVIGKYDEELDQYSFLFDTELYNNAEGAAVYLGESCFFTEQPAVDGEIYLASNSGDGAYSKAIGTLAEFNYAEGSEITAGFDSRLTRFYTLPNETHSQNFLSIPTTSHIVKYFEAALGYNNGELSNPATTPIDSGNIVWLWREALNAVALLAMVGSLFVVAAMFLSKPFFAELVQAPAVPRIKSGNKSFWIISIFIALVGAVALFFVYANKVVPNALNIILPNWIFPMDTTPNVILSWMVIVAVASVVALIANCILNKSISFKDYVEDYGLNIGLRKFGKTVLLSVLLFAAAYSSLEFIHKFFHVDYRLWLLGFDVMRPTQFFAAFRYFIVLAIIFLISGVMMNSGRMSNMKEGANTLLNALLADIGLIVPIIVMYAVSVANVTCPPTTFFLICFGLPIMLLINAYISRKMYNLTGSVWLGAITNAWLIAWMWCSITDTSFLLR